MMKEALLFIEQKMVVPLEKISAQRHLMAVRDGLLAVFPLSLIGSLFYLLTTLPLPETWAIQAFLVAHTNTLLVPYQMTTVLITLYMVVGVGANLARSYHYSQVSGSLVALASYLMTQVPVRAATLVPQAFLNSAQAQGLDTTWMQNLESLGWVMPQMPMSGIGVYVGALSAIIGVETLHFSKRLFKKVEDANHRSKSHIPDTVLQTLETILPIAMVVLLMFVVRNVIGFDFQKATLALFSRLISSANSLVGAMLFALLMSLFAFFGIIGFSVQGSAASLTWAALLAANQAAHLANAPLPNIAPLPFFTFFIWIGGIGSTLSLVALLCFSKTRYLKKLGLGCLLPSLFNVNTPVIYGLPVILNPYLFLPFVFAPVLTTLSTYLILWLGLVGRPFTGMATSLPFAVGALLVTGDWKAVILSFINFAIGIAIYFPFFKMYEKKLVASGEEKAKKLALEQKGELKATHIE